MSYVLYSHASYKPQVKMLRPSIQSVTRSGTQLLLQGQPFRFAGANMHWLALNDNGDYVSHFEVDDGFASARAMGLTVVRSHNLGISVGCANCIEPQLGVFNSEAFQHVDYAIKAARDTGIHLIIPLVDNYHYTAGGKHTFTDWRGITDENAFYTNTQVIADFKNYISVLFNHVNVYTGVKYKDDPTIMAWETGNELTPPTSWTQMISGYLKQLDPMHLVMDGRYGVDPHAASLANVDIVSDHFYPMNVQRITSDANAAQAAGKAFLVGEFQWDDSYGGDSLNAFLSAIQSNSAISGDIFWELWPHADTYGYVSNQPQFTLHYPGDTTAMQARVSLLRNYAEDMNRTQAHAESVVGSPVLETVIRNDNVNTLVWQGAIGAATYSVERSTTSASGPWTNICDQCVTDLQTPWTDKTPPSGDTWYRIIPYSTTGTAGVPSSVYQARAASLLVDDLSDWSHTYAHSQNLRFNTTNPYYMVGDASVAMRTTSTHEYITWQQPGMTSFQAITYFWPNESVDDFSLYTSADGSNWTSITPTRSILRTNWLEYVYTANNLSNTNYVKLVWNNTGGHSWNPTLGTVSISYGA
jgi:hypothetical protein